MMRIDFFPKERNRGGGMSAIAHVGAGMALKWAAPEDNVVALAIAAEVIDLVYFPPFSLFMKVPLSLTHGLFMAAVWSAVAVAIMFALRKKPRGALVMGLAVYSHWIIDFITHPMGAIMPGGSPQPPDLPLLFSGSPTVGLGLYNHSAVVAYVFEFGVTLLGVGAYVAFKIREKRLKAARAVIPVRHA
jgi:membrane-bound metal-dependent hydrolase YbcI (DUF457 family)